MNLQQWWQGAQSRERLFVGVGGAMASVILLYSLIFSPLLSKVSKVKNDLVYKQKLHTWMQTNVKILLSLRHNKPSDSVSDKPTLIIIERELKQNVLSAYVPQIKKGQKAQVQVSFEKAPFDNVIRWLGQLNQRFGVRIISANISKTSEQGFVRVNLVLEK